MLSVLVSYKLEGQHGQKAHNLEDLGVNAQEGGQPHICPVLCSISTVYFIPVLEFGDTLVLLLSILEAPMWPLKLRETNVAYKHNILHGSKSIVASLKPCRSWRQLLPQLSFDASINKTGQM